MLEAELNKAYPGTAWRSVNTGVPGYNTVMEVETLVQKGLAYSPDLVVLGLCANDYSPPKYVRVPDNVLDLRRSFLTELIVRGLSGREQHEAAPGLSHRSMWSDEEGKRVPERYADLHGKGAFLDALDQLQALSVEHGFPVVALAFHQFRPTREMMAACRERGFEVVSAQKYVVEATERQVEGPFEWWKLLETDLVVSTRNGHPSAKMHRILALKLMTMIKTRKLLQDPQGEHR